MSGSLGLYLAPSLGGSNSTCAAFLLVLRRSNDTINEKCSAEDRVHGNRKASLAHWQLAGPHPFSQGVLPISPAKLIYFSALAPIPSLKLVLTTLNLGPSPAVHRKDVRTVVTSLQSQHLTTWHGCVSSLTAVQGLGFR